MCDNEGYCVSPEMNPCAMHECNEKECGDSCLIGDIIGACNKDGECEIDISSIDCGNFI